MKKLERENIMKKVVSLLLVLALVFSIVACGTANNETEKAIVEPTETETVAPTTVPPTTTTAPPTTTKPTTTTTEAPYGSRKNPAEFGEGIEVFGELYDGTRIEYTIKLTNLRRGDEAEQIAISNNQFNEIPDGEEAIVFDVDFLLSEYDPDDDDSYWVSDYHFDYYTSTFTSFRGGSIVGSNNEFSGDLYEGGSIHGDVIMCIPEDDQGYLQFDDFVWFALP